MQPPIMEHEPKVILCPYCGHPQAPAERCIECGGFFDALSRKATQIAMGPWYIRDKARPFRPGCSYEVLVKQIKAGRIKPTTVMRGPSTRQFWTVARNVPGVAHLLGYCHACNHHVSPDADRCPDCGESFRTVPARNELGLTYPTDGEAREAQESLDRELTALQNDLPSPAPENAPASGSAPASTPGSVPENSGVTTGAGLAAGLLRDVLGDTSAPTSNKRPTPHTRAASQAQHPIPATPPAIPTAPQTQPQPSSPRSRLLNFEDDAAPRPAPAPAAAPTTTHPSQALDFSPSEDNLPGAPADADDPSSATGPRISLTIVLLILINVLLVAAVVFLFWVYLRSPDAPITPTPGTPGVPNAPRANPSPANPAPRVTSPAPTPAPEAPADNSPAHATPRPNTGAGPLLDVGGPIAPTNPNGRMPVASDPQATALADALRLEQAGRLKEAMERLMSLRQQMPRPEIVQQIDTAIDRIQKSSGKTDFFGVPHE